MTEPEQARHGSKLDEARWLGVLDSVQDAIISIDIDGRVTLFNKAAQRIFGYDAEEVLGRNVRMLMPSPYRDEHDGYLEAYRTSRSPKAIGKIRDVQGQRKNGQSFPVELSVSEARVDDDVIYTAIVRDVSERAAAESALRDGEAKIRAIVDTAVDAIITIDEAGTIESFNRGAERLFGYETVEVLGHNVRMLMPPPYSNEHDRYLADYARTGMARVIGSGRAVLARHKSGQAFPAHLTVSEVHLEHRRVFTGFVRDLSQRPSTAAANAPEIPGGADAATNALLMKTNELLTLLRQLNTVAGELTSFAVQSGRREDPGPTLGDGGGKLEP